MNPKGCFRAAKEGAKQDERLLTYLQTSLSTGNAEVTTATVVVTMLLSVVVGSLIYRVPLLFEGVLYDRRFNVTLPLMTIVSTMIILCVSSNLAFRSARSARCR